MIKNKLPLLLPAVFVSALLVASNSSAHKVIAEHEILFGHTVEPHQPEANLAKAIKSGDLDTVRQLVKSGADIGLNEQGINPSVRLAVAHGHSRILHFLLKRGAKMETERSRAFRRADENGETATNVLSYVTDAPDMMELLLQYGTKPNLIGMGKHAADQRPLLVAAKQGHLEAVQLLLAYGADPNFGAESPETPLSWALAHEHKRMLRALIRGGADVNIFPSTDDAGEPLSRRRACRLPPAERPLPPLDLALQQGNQEFVDLLIEGGAQTSVQLCSGYN